MKKSLVTALVLLLIIAIATPLVVGAVGQALEEKKYSITKDRYIYEISNLPCEPFSTFEATIKLSKSSSGGVIFSDMGYSDTFGVKVASSGALTLEWNGVHTFSGADLRTGEWTHVALVYDDEGDSLTYFVNGEKISSKKVLLESPAKENRRFFVGSDLYSWTENKTPFKGEIKQVTLYSDAISADTVKKDMASGNITALDRSDNSLIANWLFGELWGSEELIRDTSSDRSELFMKRGTYDKYVDLVDTSVAGEGYDYAFAVIPDIQAMTYKSHANLTAMSKWLVNNREKYNIRFTMYLGDLTETRYSTDAAKSTQEWQFMSKQIKLLDGKLPYTLVPGNHDYDNWGNTDRSLTNYNKYFSYDDFSSREYFGGAFEEGSIENTYYFFDVGEVEYLVFALEHTPRYTVFNWVDRIISEHPDKRVIITSHAVLDKRGEFDTVSKAAGTQTSNFEKGWEVLKKHDNIMLIFGGHNPTDWIESKTLIGDKGNTVRVYLADLQGAMMTSRMNTFLLVKVNEKDKTMSFCYYSPEYDACFNDQNQFTISFADPKNPTVGVTDGE